MSSFKSALFPFTFVSQPLAAACHVRFGQVLVYQPAAGQTPAEMEKLAADGMIGLRFPVSGEDKRLAALAGSYRDWGEVYQKDAAALKSISDTGFFHKEFVPEISTEIRKGAKPKDPQPDPVFAARLFLLLAQEYDRQTAELDHDLAATERAEKEMFSRIRGKGAEADGFFTPETPKSAMADPGAYMTESRIDAWRCLENADKDPPSVLITPSEAVVSSLEEHYEGLRPADTLPEPVSAHLKAAGDPDDGFTMKFYEIGDTGRFICLLYRAGRVWKKTDPAP